MSAVTQDPAVLSRVREYLNKRHGSGTVMNYRGVVTIKEAVTSGHPFVDWVLGGPGFYYGKNIELFGPESSGKSTIAYTAAANAQRRKRKTGRVLLVDLENSFDLRYFKRLGGSDDLLEVSQPDDAESALEVMQVYVDNDLVDMILVDSVAAMMSFRESGLFVDSSGKQLKDQLTATDKTKQLGGMGETNMGLHARVMSQGLKQLNMRIAKHEVCVIWINQTRTEIRTYGPAGETTTGGKALKFYAAVRLELRKKEAVKGKIIDPFEGKEKDGIIAIKTIVKAAKNKEAPPFREAPITIRFGTGMDIEGDLLDFCVKQKLVAKNQTGWYDLKALGASRNARGKADFRTLLAEEPTIKDKLLKSLDFEKTMDGMDAVVVDEPETDPAVDRSGEVDPGVEAALSEPQTQQPEAT